MQGCMSGMVGNKTGLCEGLQQLKNEHPPLLDRLDHLLQLSTKVQNHPEGKDDFQQLIIDVIEFFEELEPHSEREEGILFPMMATYIGKEMGPIAVMEYEHDQAKALIGTFLERTKNDKDFTAEEKVQLADLVKNANYILVDHFSKEENILFSMAENLLSNEEKEELLKRINE